MVSMDTIISRIPKEKFSLGPTFALVKIPPANTGVLWAVGTTASGATALAVRGTLSARMGPSCVRQYTFISFLLEVYLGVKLLRGFPIADIADSARVHTNCPAGFCLVGPVITTLTLSLLPFGGEFSVEKMRVQVGGTRSDAGNSVSQGLEVKSGTAKNG